MAFAKAFQKLHRLPPNYYSSTSPLSAIATTRLSRTISTQTESSKKTILTFNRQSNALLQSLPGHRLYSDSKSNKKRDDDDDDDDERERRPTLGDDCQSWPSIFGMMTALPFQLYIRWFLDRSFNFQDFVVGTKQAVETVSQKLAAGDFDNLSELVVDDELDRVKEIVGQMSFSERSQLAIDKDDIYVAFPYHIKMYERTNPETKVKRTSVKITMVYHVLRGLKELRESNADIPMNMTTRPDLVEKLWIINYGFQREYAKDVDSEWTVNMIKHHQTVAEEDE